MVVGGALSERRDRHRGTSTFPPRAGCWRSIESGDVIHDFWAPELARKMDAVPGRKGYIWLEADAPGTYAGSLLGVLRRRACLDAISRDRRAGAGL